MTGKTKLLNKVKSIKANVERFRTHLNTLTEGNEVDFDNLSTRLKSIEHSLNAYKDLQCEIDDDVDEPFDVEFENSFFDAIATSQKIMSLDPRRNINPTATTAGSHQDAPMQNSLSHVKLPVMHLPTFSGAFEDWLPFHDTFDSLIHCNSTLNNVQKFHYLKSCLKGDAADTIHSLQVTNQNYDVAWTTLRGRYENKKLIVDNHIQKLFNLPVVEKECSSSLRSHLDNFLKHVRALQAIDEPKTDTILIHLSTTKLDAITRDKWEECRLQIQQPSLSDLSEFLQNRCQVLDSRPQRQFKSTQPTNTREQPYHQKSPSRRLGHTSSAFVSVEAKCTMCKQNHELYQCPSFLRATPSERLQHVRASHLCVNCMRTNHNVIDCKSGTCRTCHKRHNTLLHLQETGHTTTNRSSPPVAESSSAAHAVQSFNAIQSSTKRSHVLLSTAVIYARDYKDNLHECRVLLDNGSQSNFVTAEMANILQLPQRGVNIPISGIGSSHTRSSKMVDITIQSRVSRYEENIPCLVINKVTDNLPINTINIQEVNIPDNIQLADPTFNQSNCIDMLIGAAIFWDLLSTDRIKVKTTSDISPILQNTAFGWIISGPISFQDDSKPTWCHVSQELDVLVRKFWKSEELTSNVEQPHEHFTCETHFRARTTHDDCRFTVRLPFNDINKLELTNQEDSQHIRTHDNPADLVSRGCNAEHLLNSQWWWTGPDFLKQESSCWPQQPQPTKKTLPDENPTVIALTVVNDATNDWFQRRPSLPRISTQFMGTPPAVHTQQLRLFVNTDVDFCGLFHILDNPHRGANSELENLPTLFSQHHKSALELATAEDGIQWNFIPARSPHFGGIWEAAVKSAKHHMVRVAGSTAMTYEEFSTLLTQIEACLNSRPLMPLTDDPADLLILTPGHFLFGEYLTAIPVPDTSHVQLNRLSRWQRITQMFRSFWNIRSREYLSTLQERRKWTHSSSNQLTVGSLVIIKEENTPPLRWHLGVIHTLHAGPDGVSRMATARTSKSTQKIAVHRLAAHYPSTTRTLRELKTCGVSRRPICWDFLSYYATLRLRYFPVSYTNLDLRESTA